MAERKPAAAPKPWTAVWNLLRLLRDLSDWNGQRLTAIEDRLAALDRGLDAAGARKLARNRLGADRAERGLPTDLAFKLKDGPS